VIFYSKMSDNPFLQIVGVEKSDRGRACEYHKCWGEQLCVGSLIRLRKKVIVTDEGPEVAVVANVFLHR
jgi:hypothetical protein